MKVAALRSANATNPATWSKITEALIVDNVSLPYLPPVEIDQSFHRERAAVTSALLSEPFLTEQADLSALLIHDASTSPQAELSSADAMLNDFFMPEASTSINLFEPIEGPSISESVVTRTAMMDDFFMPETASTEEVRLTDSVFTSASAGNVKSAVMDDFFMPESSCGNASLFVEVHSPSVASDPIVDAKLEDFFLPDLPQSLLDEITENTLEVKKADLIEGLLVDVVPQHAAAVSM